MSEREALGAALDKLIPKTLGEVITLNRDHGELRIATAADLDPLRAKVPRNDFVHDIGDWTLVALDWHPKGPPGQVLVALFGYNIDRHEPWNTSQVMQYDDETRCLRTKSGTLYRVVNEPSEKPDVLRVCAWVHSARIGVHLGVMHVFY